MRKVVALAGLAVVFAIPATASAARPFLSAPTALAAMEQWAAADNPYVLTITRCKRLTRRTYSCILSETLTESAAAEFQWITAFEEFLTAELHHRSTVVVHGSMRT